MDFWKEFWGGLKRESRIALIVGIILIFVLAVVLVVWSFSNNYGVLFSHMQERDTAAVIAELERMGVDYKLADGSNEILVPENKVHKIRLKLMESGLPFQGGVGFEIFDNSDFGMTEFAQKINYQRALQGELTRTISSLSEIKFARVHLVLPENSLFKKDQAQPHASITIFLKPGRNLDHKEIHGIQRLVAASVPELLTKNVVIVDENGDGLTRQESGDNEGQASTKAFEKKKEIEKYFSEKINKLLSKVFVNNDTVVSVDVTLNMDQIKSTEENVIPQANGSEAVARKSESKTNSGGKTLVKGSKTATEVEYKLGRKIEQIVHMPGTIQRMSVGILVPKGTTIVDVHKIQDLVEAVVGFDKSRGDIIAIHTLNGETKKNSQSEYHNHNLVQSSSDKKNINTFARFIYMNWVWVISALLGFVLLMGIIFFVIFAGKGNTHANARMSDAERDKLLLQLKEWLSESDNKVEEGHGAS